MRKNKNNIKAELEKRVQELESREARFRAILEKNADGIIIVDRRGVVRFANPSAEALFGRNPGELIGKSFGFPVVVGQSSEVTVMQKGGRENTVEMRAAEMRATYAELKDEVVFLISLRDISGRKKLEEELRKHAHDLGERVKELDCLYGVSHLMTRSDKPLDEIIREMVDLIPAGWQYPEVTCARIVSGGREFMTDNFNETVWKQSADIRVLEEKVGALEVCYLEEKPAADEGPFLKEERNLIDSLGREIGLSIQRLRSQKELRQRERRFRTLVENLPQKVFLKDKNSVYISCNANYARDLGIEPDQISGKEDYEFYPKELAQKYRADGERVMTSGKTEEREEQYVREGQQRWVHIVRTPVRDENGNVTGVLGIFWDITERKKMEEDNKKHLYELEVFYNASTGREERILDLKKEIRRLEKQLGREK